MCTFPSAAVWGWRMLQDVSSIYLWSCTSAFSAIEPSASVSQGKLTSLLIALLVITECSWRSAVSSLGDIFSLRLSFLPAARSNNSPQTISERALFFLTTGKVSVNTQGGTGGLRQGDITRMNFLPCQCPSIQRLLFTSMAILTQLGRHTAMSAFSDHLNPN